MRIVVCSHRLEIGGSQTNAIDLAHALASRGHEVTLFAMDGPARELASRRRVKFVQAPDRTGVISPKSSLALCQLVRAEAPDIVHAYEWPQCLDAYYGPYLLLGIPIVFTILSMTVPRWLPKRTPLVVGTAQLQHELGPSWHAPIFAIEPPIDTELDNPEALEASRFRQALGLQATSVHLVIVSRLVESMKLEGIRRAIAATPLLALSTDIHLTVVGDGPARPRLEALADRVNAQIGRPVITVFGPMLDPRPAYAAADLVLGMGSSVLRAMSFGKPVIVLGEHGFSEPVTETTLETFTWTGFYGFGSGNLAPDKLATQIGALIADRREMCRLGALGRQVVEQRFSLNVAARRLEDVYRVALSTNLPRTQAYLSACLPTAHIAVSRFVPPEIRTHLQRLLPRSLRPKPQPWESK